MDSRVIDGFGVSFYGNMVCIKYQSDIKLKEMGIDIGGEHGYSVGSEEWIDKVNEDTAVLDFNHPLAGKNLNFEIELLSVDN